MKVGDMIKVKGDDSGNIWHSYMEKYGIIIDMVIDDGESAPALLAIVDTEIAEFYLDEIEVINDIKN